MKKYEEVQSALAAEAFAAAKVHIPAATTEFLTRCINMGVDAPKDAAVFVVYWGVQWAKEKSIQGHARKYKVQQNLHTRHPISTSQKESWQLLYCRFYTLLSAAPETSGNRLLSSHVHSFCCCCCLQVLLGYRLSWPRRATRALLSFSIVYYIATRLLQTVMVVYMIIGWASYPAVRMTAAFIVVASMFGAFSVIQAYTLVIYCAIGRKLSMEGKGIDSSADAAAEEA
jgi:hypothetical protein